VDDREDPYIHKLINIQDSNYWGLKITDNNFDAGNRASGLPEKQNFRENG